MTRISRRRLLAAGAAASAALGAPAINAQAQVTITFRFNDPEAPQMRAALDAFERANPAIKVTMQMAAHRTHAGATDGRMVAKRLPKKTINVGLVMSVVKPRRKEAQWPASVAVVFRRAALGPRALSAARNPR